MWDIFTKILIFVFSGYLAFGLYGGTVVTTDGKRFNGEIVLQEKGVSIKSEGNGITVSLSDIVDVEINKPAELKPYIAVFPMEGKPPEMPLPNPWRFTDIGETKGKGETSFSYAGNKKEATFTLKSYGSGIGDKKDSIHFAYVPVEGNFIITARVTYVQATAREAQAGVMARAEPSAESQFICVSVTSGEGALVKYRREKGGSVSQKSLGDLRFPCFIKLERSDDDFRIYTSKNGNEWKLLKVSINLPANLLIGLFNSSSSKNNAVNNSRFADVSLFKENPSERRTTILLKDGTILKLPAREKINFDGNSFAISLRGKVKKLARDEVSSIFLSEPFLEMQSKESRRVKGAVLWDGSIIQGTLKELTQDSIKIQSDRETRVYKWNEVSALFLSDIDAGTHKFEIYTIEGDTFYPVNAICKNDAILISTEILGDLSISANQLWKLQRTGQIVASDLYKSSGDKNIARAITVDGRKISGECVIEGERIVIKPPGENPASLSLKELRQLLFDRLPMYQSEEFRYDKLIWGNIGGTRPCGRHFINTNSIVIEGGGLYYGSQSKEPFYFVAGSLKDNVSVISKLTDFDDAGKRGFAGICALDNKQPARVGAMICVSSNSLYFWHRVEDRLSKRIKMQVELPIWLRLDIIKNNVLGYYSKNGVNWVLCVSEYVKMAGDYVAGIAIEGSEDGKFARAVFEDLQFRKDSRIERETVIVLTNGTRIICSSVNGDESSIKFKTSAGESLTIPTEKVSALIFMTAAEQYKQLLNEDRSGVWLLNNDFVEGEFKWLRDNNVRIGSVILGIREFSVSSQVQAVFLRKPTISREGIVVNLVDGSILQCASMDLSNEVLLAKELCLDKTFEIPISKISEITRK